MYLTDKYPSKPVSLVYNALLRYYAMTLEARIMRSDRQWLRLNSRTSVLRSVRGLSVTCTIVVHCVYTQVESTYVMIE